MLATAVVPMMPAEFLSCSLRSVLSVQEITLPEAGVDGAAMFEYRRFPATVTPVGRLTFTVTHDAEDLVTSPV